MQAGYGPLWAAITNGGGLRASIQAPGGVYPYNITQNDVLTVRPSDLIGPLFSKGTSCGVILTAPYWLRTCRTAYLGPRTKQCDMSIFAHVVGIYGGMLQSKAGLYVGGATCYCRCCRSATTSRWWR